MFNYNDTNIMKKYFFILCALAVVITSSARKLTTIHVDGKNFVDANGNTVIFRGLCFSDPVKLITEGKWGEEYFCRSCIMECQHCAFPHPSSKHQQIRMGQDL